MPRTRTEVRSSEQSRTWDTWEPTEEENYLDAQSLQQKFDMFHQEQSNCANIQSAPAVNSIELTRAGLRRVTETLDLRNGDLAHLIGAESEVVDSWLASDLPPPRWMPKIATIIKIADMLRKELREGHPRIVVRKPAEAYGNLTMLDLIATNQHEWLAQDLEEMFEYSTTA